MTTHTEREILSQPEVWQQTIDSLDPMSFLTPFSNDVTDVLVTGCGSTYYLALSAAALLRDSGLRAWALPASELISAAQPQLANAGGTLLLAISRSGTTSETLMAVEHFRRIGGHAVAVITCYPDSPLAEAADIVWAAPASAEQSVAQTRSFTSMQVIVSAIAGALRGGDLSALHALPPAAGGVLERSRSLMASLAREPGIESFYFLGSGALYGIASEGMLKLKEMSLTASEAYHTMEFRHGPMSMCDESAAVIALVSTERASLEEAVLKDISPFGAQLVTIGAEGLHQIPANLPSWAAPALYLLPLQLLALERALHKGLDPDNPRHLTAVIYLDESRDAS
ncbi:MAG: SIS domain-containing protein [Actinomycetia bacterium]|nr:SIS domain-containing protein [Actinomycetes bacterium]